MYAAHINAAGAVQSSEAHCRGTAQRASAELVDLGLAQCGYLAGLLHDAGKFTPEFDAYIHEAVAGRGRRGSVIHTFTAVSYLMQTYHAGKLDYAAATAEILSAAVGSHHEFFDVFNRDKVNGFEYRQQKQPDYDRRAMAAFFENCAGEDEVRALFEAAVQEVAAVFQQMMSAFQSSRDNFFFALGLLTRLVVSAVVEGDRADTASFMEDEALPPVSEGNEALWGKALGAVEGYLSRMPAQTPIQQARRAFSQACADFSGEESGIYRLDLPTGGGKTLSSLRYALAHARRWGKRRIIYVAPLLSIIDQNAQSMRAALGPDIPILEHHSDMTGEKSQGEQLERSEWLEQTWDAPIIITTLVRMLDTLFAGGMTSVRRFKALVGSVILFDEIQSLPIKMISQFNIAVNFLNRICGATVVLCSATQPGLERADRALLLDQRRVVPENLLDTYASLFKRTNIVDGGRIRLEEVAARAWALQEEYGSLLVVCNTKKEAGAVYDALNTAPVRRFYLAASLCMAHRKAVLDELMKALSAGEKLICVSTQVIEAGIDISFGAVVRFSAGLDNIVQAAGRCNRHGEFDRVRPVQVVQVENERLGNLEDIERAKAAYEALLAEYKRDPATVGGDLASMAAVDYYYDCLYRDLPKEFQDNPGKNEPKVFDLLARNKIWTAGVKAAQGYWLRQAFKSAGERFEVFDSGTQAVLVPYQEGQELIGELGSARACYDLGYTRALIDRARSYSVTLYQSEVERLRRKGAVYELPQVGVYVLQAECYDEHKGVLSGIKEEETSCDTPIW